MQKIKYDDKTGKLVEIVGQSVDSDTVIAADENRKFRQLFTVEDEIKIIREIVAEKFPGAFRADYKAALTVMAANIDAKRKETEQQELIRNKQQWEKVGVEKVAKAFLSIGLATPPEITKLIDLEKYVNSNVKNMNDFKDGNAT